MEGSPLFFEGKGFARGSALLRSPERCEGALELGNQLVLQEPPQLTFTAPAEPHGLHKTPTTATRSRWAETLRAKPSSVSLASRNELHWRGPATLRGCGARAGLPSSSTSPSLQRVGLFQIQPGASQSWPWDRMWASEEPLVRPLQNLPNPGEPLGKKVIPVWAPRPREAAQEVPLQESGACLAGA